MKIKRICIAVFAAAATLAATCLAAVVSMDAAAGRVTLPGVQVTSNLVVGGLPAQSNIMVGVGNVQMQGAIYGTNVQAAAYVEKSIGNTKAFPTFPYGNAEWRRVYRTLSGNGILANVVVSKGNQIFEYDDYLKDIIYSSDGGANWRVLRRISDVVGVKNILAIDQIDNDTFLFGGTASSIYRTTNFFATITTNWIGANAAIDSINHDDKNNIIACTDYSYILKSTNNGVSWTSNSLNTARSSGLNMRAVYAGRSCWVTTTMTNIHYSSDSGDTWTKVFVTPSNTFGLVAGENGTVILGASDAMLGFNIYKSRDYGLTWKKVFGTANVRPYGVCYGGNGRFFIGVQTGIKCYESVDDGETWTSFNVAGYGTSTLLGIGCTKDALIFGCGSTNGGIFIKSAAFKNDLSTGESGLLIMKGQSVGPVATLGGMYVDNLGQPYVCTNSTTWTAVAVE